MAWLLSDIRTWCRDNDVDDSSSRATRNYDRMANDANRALHNAGDWRFDRTRERLLFDAAKTSGTIAVTIDGTAVTGTSTAFSSSGTVSDVGKFFRFSGQAYQYRCSAVASATAVTLGEAYRGTTLAAGGFSYALTHDRIALSARVRKLALPAGDDDLFELEPVTLDELLFERLHSREVGIPRICAEEDFTTDTVGLAPDLYLWIYPSPTSRTILDIPVYRWPVEMSGVGDSISAPVAAESAYREYLRAFLLWGQGKTQEYSNQLAVAAQRAHSDLAQFRASSHGGCREMWTPQSDFGGFTRRMRPAAGEPVHE